MYYWFNMLQNIKYRKIYGYQLNFVMGYNVLTKEKTIMNLTNIFESTDFEDAIRNAISIGGDSDTVAAICGGVAQAYYGIPTDIRKQALSFLDTKLLGILTAFEEKFIPVVV